MLLSQEHIGEHEDGVKRAQSRKTSSYGSSVPLMLTQLYLSLQRKLLTGDNDADERVLVKGERRYNAMGEQRFWALKGNATGLGAKLVISAANEGAQGAVVPAWFESDLFNVIDPEKAKRKDPLWGLPSYEYLLHEEYAEGV